MSGTTWNYEYLLVTKMAGHSKYNIISRFKKDMVYEFLLTRYSFAFRCTRKFWFSLQIQINCYFSIVSAKPLWDGFLPIYIQLRFRFNLKRKQIPNHYLKFTTNPYLSSLYNLIKYLTLILIAKGTRLICGERRWEQIHFTSIASRKICDTMLRKIRKKLDFSV